MSEQDTAEKPNSSWGNDDFERHEDGEFILAFIKGRLWQRELQKKKRSYVLNVDGDWGSGKSFFLEGMERYLKNEGHPVAFVNAWRDDFTADPLVAFMAAIEDATRAFLSPQKAKEFFGDMKRNGGKLVSRVALGAVTKGLNKLTGLGLNEVIDTATKNDALGDDIAEIASEALSDASPELHSLFSRTVNQQVNDFRASRSAIESFGRSIEKLVEQSVKKKDTFAPLFVIVDELDRCRPSYAIALLERVKHLFAVNNVVFIFGTNTGELSNAVQAVYGPQFDGKRYLDRFFDRTYRLQSPSITQFIQNRWSPSPYYKIATMPSLDQVEYLSYIFEKSNLKLRSIEQCLDLFDIIASVWSEKFPIYLQLIIPMIIEAHKGTEPSFTKDFARQFETGGRTDVHSVMKFRGVVQGTQYMTPRQSLDLDNTADTQDVFLQFLKLQLLDNEKLYPPHGAETGLAEWVRGCAQVEKDLGNRRFSPANYPALIATAGRLTTATGKL